MIDIGEQTGTLGRQNGSTQTGCFMGPGTHNALAGYISNDLQPNRAVRAAAKDAKLTAGAGQAFMIFDMMTEDVCDTFHDGTDHIAGRSFQTKTEKAALAAIQQRKKEQTAGAGLSLRGQLVQFIIFSSGLQIISNGPSGYKGYRLHTGFD